jgi:hypothetical protein
MDDYMFYYAVYQQADERVTPVVEGKIETAFGDIVDNADAVLAKHSINEGEYEIVLFYEALDGTFRRLLTSVTSTRTIHYEHTNRRRV